MTTLEEGAGSLWRDKDVLRLCREKIRRAKAQLELNLAADVKKQRCLCTNTSSVKRRATENLHPLLDAGGKH